MSPQQVEKSAEVKSKLRLNYPILQDPGNGYAKQLSIAHGLPEDLQEVYRGFGADLTNFNSEPHWELPLATRIVVDRTGIIRSIDADPDYTRRPEPAATLAVLGELAH